jgi:hypothetical protein
MHKEMISKYFLLIADDGPSQPIHLVRLKLYKNCKDCSDG